MMKSDTCEDISAPWSRSLHRESCHPGTPSNGLRALFFAAFALLGFIPTSSCQPHESESAFIQAVGVFDQKLCVASESDVSCRTESDEPGGPSVARGAGHLFSLNREFDGRDSERELVLETREATCLGSSREGRSYSVACAQWILRGLYPLPVANDLDIVSGDGLTSVVCVGTNAGVICTRFVSDEKKRVLRNHSVLRVAGGAHHVCGLAPSGAIHCAALDTRELLQGSVMKNRGLNCGQLSPPSSGTFTEISSGSVHTCALSTTGEIRCWGAGDRATQNGCLAEERVNHGQARPPRGRFTSVVTGKFHSCGLHRNREVKCWGENAHGEANPPDRKFGMLAAGGHSTCGVTVGGKLVCWGKAAGLGSDMEDRLREGRATSQ